MSKRPSPKQVYDRVWHGEIVLKVLPDECAKELRISLAKLRGYVETMQAAKKILQQRKAACAELAQRLEDDCGPQGGPRQRAG
jgi:hypothetical protein